jgi:hypothetical protein
MIFVLIFSIKDYIFYYLIFLAIKQVRDQFSDQIFNNLMKSLTKSVSKFNHHRYQIGCQFDHNISSIRVLNWLLNQLLIY